MASIKELRIRIRSLKNTNKITAAMKLVATSKLKKSQDSMKANYPFSEKLAEVLQRVVSNLSSDEISHPLLEQRPIKKIRYYLFSSDKGLCGNFNNGLVKYFKTIDKNIDFEVHTVGKKAYDFLHKDSQYNVVKNWDGLTKTLDDETIIRLVDEAIEDYINGDYDQAILVYNKFESVISQNPSQKLMIPVQTPENEKKSSNTSYLFEPDSETLLAELLPQFVQVSLYQALLENAAGEHGARMTAMDNATKNSKELIDNLTIVMNRARQAAITTELTEIVSGAESLKG